MTPFSGNVATYHTFHKIRGQIMLWLSFIRMLYIIYPSKIRNNRYQITVLRDITFFIHDYITVRLAQYFVHLNSSVIRHLATSITFVAPPKRPAYSGKTIVMDCKGSFTLNKFCGWLFVKWQNLMSVETRRREYGIAIVDFDKQIFIP